MKVCEQCGKSISEEANFCSSCGETIRKSKKMQEDKVQVKQVEEQVTEITDDAKAEDFKNTPSTQSIEVMGQPKDSNIILRNVHCPYCNTNNALLISETTSTKMGLQMPAYGLRYVLSLLYIGPLYIMMNGFKTIEATRNINHITYGFCPNCGNSYSANAPKVVKDDIKEPTFYKNTDEKVVMGLCKGISEYTDIPVLWIRIVTVFLGITIIGAITYFIVALCVPDKGSSTEVINKEVADNASRVVKKALKIGLIVIAAAALIGLGIWGFKKITSNSGNNTTNAEYQTDIGEEY